MRTRFWFFGSAALFGSVVFACSGVSRSSFSPGTDAGSSSSSTGGLVTDSGCATLECKVATDCPNGAKTTLRGKVYDPAGAVPLYNVRVYVPSGSEPENLPPLKNSFTDGITCETCASTVVSPLRTTLTDSNGEFVLENVPVDDELPLVIQVGKWRRFFKVKASKKCEENVAPDRSIRLPRNGKEGDMPQIAVSSGALDTLECMLRGVGIDDSEFVEGNAPNGHVHIFQGYGGGMGTPAQDFWTSIEQMKRYDMMLLSCESDQHRENKGDLSTMYDYLNAGGKVFATHYHYTWFQNSPHEELSGIASWKDLSLTEQTYSINQTFPKGADYAKWLQAIGATSTVGQIALQNVRSSVVSTSAEVTTWIADSKNVPKYFSFNMPLKATPEEQCGRAVFSDIHIYDLPLGKSPATITACPITAGGLDPQQKALEFLFFDLSACVSNDSEPPPPQK